MKNLRIALAVALLTLMYVEAGAQVFISGHIGFSSQGGKEKNGSVTVDKQSTNSLTFSPAVGFEVTENFAVGLAISASSSKTKYPNATETIDKSSSFGFAPFVRYYALNWDKISVFGEGSLGVYSGSSSRTISGQVNDGPKTSTFVVSVVPGVEYKISDHIALQTTIDVFSLQYYYRKETEGNSKDTASQFNFGAGLDNVASTNAIHIGAIYRF